MVRLLVIDDNDIKNNDIQKLAKRLKGCLDSNDDELLLQDELCDEEFDEDLLKEDFASCNFGISSTFVIASIKIENDSENVEFYKVEIENELERLINFRVNFEINWKDDFNGIIFLDNSIIDYAKLLQDLKDNLEFEIFIVLTQKETGFEELAEIEKIQEMHMQYYFYNLEKIKIVGQCQAFKNIDYKGLNHLEILKEARLLNVKKMLVLICEALEVFREERVKPSDVKNFIKFILTNIKLVNLDITNGQLSLLDEAIEKVDSIDNIKKLIEYVRMLELPLKNAFIVKKYRNEVESVIEFINNNIERKITLEMIANHISMNESYISRIFKLETGESITSYINKIKMDTAARLLSDKNIMIKEASIKVGVDDQFYFNKLFKKYKGVSPSEYRKI